jgi:hypothetical protein
MKKRLAELVLEDNQRPVSERSTDLRATHRESVASEIADDVHRERFRNLLAKTVKTKK